MHNLQSKARFRLANSLILSNRFQLNANTFTFVIGNKSSSDGSCLSSVFEQYDGQQS